jgi:ArsR family metal-binding transcriptional regulator
VYAVDTSNLQVAEESEAIIYSYSISADPDPDVLLRIAAVFLLANVSPRRVSFERRQGDRIIAIAEMGEITAATADFIRRKLEQLTCLASVSMEKHLAASHDNVSLS